MRILWIIPVCSALMLTGCGTGVNIWTAVEKEDLDAIARYAERGGDLNTGVTFYEKTPLLHALLLGKKLSYQKLLDLGADPNFPCGRKNLTVMHHAASNGDSTWLKQALVAKGNPNLMATNASKANQGTVLWWAVMGNRIENVQTLLDAGVDVNAYAHNDQTALAVACRKPVFLIALLLLKNGADFLKPAGYTSTTVFRIKEKLSVVKSGHRYAKEDLSALSEIVAFLKADGFDPETAVWDGRKLIWKQP